MEDDGWMAERMDGWLIDGWQMDGWMEGWSLLKLLPLRVNRR